MNDDWNKDTYKSGGEGQESRALDHGDDLHISDRPKCCKAWKLCWSCGNDEIAVVVECKSMGEES